MYDYRATIEQLEQIKTPTTKLRMLKLWQYIGPFQQKYDDCSLLHLQRNVFKLNYLY